MMKGLPIVIFLGLAIVLGTVLILAAVVLAVRNPDPEKVSAYECGFNAFDDARMKFDVRFYLVAILFIISSSRCVTANMTMSSADVSSAGDGVPSFERFGESSIKLA